MAPRRLRVLVADDNAVARTLARALLVRMGCEVVVAGTGRQAVEKADADPFYDLVLMHVQMPDMDAYDAARELRSRGYDGPILALTASAGPSERAACADAGMNGVLEKPVGRDVLDSVLTTLGINLARAA
jgi:CheY-like chemotaxis protein